jgi:hypothetical protein
MTKTTESKVEYLTETKFRKAVKKATRFNVFGKNENGRYGIFIRPASVLGHQTTLFEVLYAGGHFRGHAENQLRNQLTLERELTLAGFELVAYEKHASDIEIVTAYAWKKVA